jgi:hypothetical protein
MQLSQALHFAGNSASACTFFPPLELQSILPTTPLQAEKIVCLRQRVS